MLCAGVVVLRHSSLWLLFAAALDEVTDVGLQAFSGAVASSPTLTTVTIVGACVGSGREPGSDVPGVLWHVCEVVLDPAQRLCPLMRGEARVVVAAGVRVLWFCAAAHRGCCLPQTFAK